MNAEDPEIPGDRNETPVPNEGGGTGPGEDIIRIESLTKIFQNTRTVVAVDNVSFTVKRGEIFGLLGPNGAGKSTLIRILTTLMKPTSGTASVESYDVVRDPEKIRSRIGVCPQNSTLDLELSAYDNLDFYGRLQDVDDTTLKTRIPELLAMVGLADRADARVSTFSGGMRRKLEIVRAFIHHPSILFLDEPTIGLDPESRREVWKQINQLNTEETTIILTTHYMDEAEKLCDRIAFMEGGRLISLDTPANLKQAMPGGDLIEIGFDELREGIVPAVQSHPSVVSVEVQGQKMLISAHAGSSLLPAILADFERFSIPVSSITIRSPSLEDVFIYLTGRKLDDSGVNGPLPPPGRRV